MDMIAPFALTICGIDELLDHRETGVSHVLSILDPGYPEPEAFGRFRAHRRLELRFHDVIEHGTAMAAPQREDVACLLDFGRDLAKEPPEATHLLVHCHAGISRSTAAMALIIAQLVPDLPASEIMREVVRLRPPAWPNLRIIELGDALLARNGEIVAAAAEVYRRQINSQPHMAGLMTLGGRGREILAAGGR
ncbi:MAG: protein-tyrosine-phosphatase [Rhodopila sp.]|nr:protein-tyrosine-phosphatase [Rhodopila sp.]